MERAPCGCARGDSVVGTCPQCLPRGAIAWLIENGRQLNMFEGPPEPVEVPGVLATVRADDGSEDCLSRSEVTDHPGEDDLPF